jgi:FMN-dependent NADH-azoreductase
MKNVLAFNGSPRGKNGNTEKILKPFLEGATQAGATAETLYLKDLNIHECLGCYTCHMKTPGICAIKDDMEIVLKKMLASDILVFATPLYVFTVSALLKTLMDRMMILGDMKIIIANGRTAHPPRFPEKKWQWVLISNAGFPEREHFGALEDTFARFAHAFGGGTHATLSGSILKGMGEIFRVKALLPGFQWFFDACTQAGKETILDGKFSPATQEILDRPLLDLPLQDLVNMTNQYIDKAAQIIRGSKQ